MVGFYAWARSAARTQLWGGFVVWRWTMDVDGSMPTVSPSTIPLVYCHIKSFQQASRVERPWPGGEKRTAGRASHHEEWCGDWVVSPPVWTTGLSLIAVRGLIGATPWGQPWTPAVTLPPGCDGRSARRMAVLLTFREPSLCRHVRREFMRKVLLDFTLINQRC